jgi:Fe-S-cluster containining protein
VWEKLPQVRCVFALRCSHCPACCRLIRVPLTHTDLKRLLASSRLPTDQVVEWMSPEDIDMSGEPESFVQLSVGRRIMVLRHEAGACVLLSKEGLCTVHPSRPAPCGAYPYAFADEPSERRLLVLPGAPCQLPLDSQSPSGNPPATETIRDAVERVEKELREYWQEVAAWNRRQRRRSSAGRRPQTAEKFLSTLGLDEP